MGIISQLHASVALTLVNGLPVHTVEGAGRFILSVCPLTIEPRSHRGSEYNLVTIPTDLSWFLPQKRNSKYIISKTLMVGNSMHVSREAS